MIAVEPGSVGHKRVTVAAILSCGTLLTYCDGRRDDVVIPSAFRQGKLILRWAYGLTPPIEDLSVGEHGISGILAFGGVNSYVFVPFSALYGAVLEDTLEGVLWQDDMPADIKGDGEDETPDVLPPRPKLKLVD